MIVRMDFTCYENMRFSRWIAWAQSGQSALEHFGKIDIENIDDYHTLDLQNIFYWLEPLKEAYDLPTKPTSIINKSYAQKLDAVLVCKEFEKNKKLVEVLPYLLAIFEQDSKTYTKEIEQFLGKYNNMLFPEAYQKSMGWLLGMQDYEATMQKKLKPIPYTPEQEKAGVKEFEAHGEYNTMESLTGGDVLKQEMILAQSLLTISKSIIYSNLKAWYERNISLNQIAEMRNKNRKK